MGSKTGVIVYNVRERGRRHRGQDRTFETAPLAQIINGGDVQERVANRDLLGYFGHGPRVKFGMYPAEGGVIDGRYVAVEPAITTTFIRAMPDGTVEHEAEFLDTATGKLAERMWNSKVGGFSSAINTVRQGAKDVPVAFYGFDYVNEPNYTTNRGYRMALDSVSEDDFEALTLLDRAADYRGMAEAMNSLYDGLQSQYDLLAAALKASELEREELMSMLARGAAGVPVLDSCVKPKLLPVERHRFDSAQDFLSMNLPGFEQPKPKPAPDAIQTRAAGRTLHSMFG